MKYFICLCCILLSFSMTITCAEQNDDGARIFDGEEPQSKTQQAREGDDEDEEDEEDEDEEGQEAFLKRLHGYLSEHHPGLDRLLLRAKKEHEDFYQDVAEELAWKVIEHLEMEEEEPDRDEAAHRKHQRQRFLLQIKESELRLEIRLASIAFDRSERKDQASANKIKSLVPKLFAVLVELRALELRQLKQETAQLEAELKELTERKEAVIQQKVDDLLRKELLDW